MATNSDAIYVNKRYIIKNKKSVKTYKQYQDYVIATSVSNGGTGMISYNKGDLITAESSDVLTTISAVSSGYALVSNGINEKPKYGKINIMTTITGILSVEQGGTGLTTYKTGDILYASGTTVLTKLEDIATTNILLSGGIGVAPSYGKVDFATTIEGILPAINGGTNSSSYTVGDIIYATGTNTLGRLSDIAIGNVIISGGIGFVPSYGKIDLATAITGILPSVNGGLGGTGTYTTDDLLCASPSGVIPKGTTSQSLLSQGVGTIPAYGLVNLTTHVSNILPAANGGTSFGTGNTYTIGDILYATATNTLGKLSSIATGNVLLSQGVGNLPSYGKLDVSTSIVSGILPGNKGGTNSSSYTIGDMIYAASSTVLGKLVAGTSGFTLQSTGVGAVSTYGLINVASYTTGILPVSKQGTGLSSYSNGDLLYASGPSTLAKLTKGTSGLILTSGGIGVAPSWGFLNLQTMVTGYLPRTKGGFGDTTNVTSGLLYIAGGVSNTSTPPASSLYTRVNSGATGVEYVPTMRILGRASTSIATVLTCLANIPNDNTIPQITEGSLVSTLSYTPISASSTLYMYIQVSLGNNGISPICMALFKNSNANAVACTYLFSTLIVGNGTLNYTVASGSTSLATWTLRVGAEVGTCYINGSTLGTRLLGGSQLITMTIFEYIN